MVFGNNLIDFGAFVATNTEPTVVKTQNIDVVRAVKTPTSSNVGQVNEVNSITIPPSPTEQGSVEETDVSAVVNNDVNEEVLGEPDLGEITDTSSGIRTNASGEEVGLSGLSQSDEEQLQDKADETHISGGNDPMSETTNVQNKNGLVGGILVMVLGLGIYFYENKTSFFTKKIQEIKQKIRR